MDAAAEMPLHCPDQPGDAIHNVSPPCLSADECRDFLATHRSACHVICLKRRPDRWSACTAAMDAALGPLPYEMFPAVDGSAAQAALEAARAAAQASLATAGGSPLVVMGASQTTEHRRSYSASVASFSTNESSDAFCAAGARSIASSRP